MANQTITFTKFDGGISANSKSGLPNACRFSRFLDIYTDSDSVSLNPIPVKDSGSTVTGLVKWMVDPYPYDTTNRYAYDDAGNIYTIAGSSWAVDRSGATIGNGAAGQGLGFLSNYLFYATSTTLGRKGLLNGTPTYNDDFVTDGTQNLDQADTTSYSNTYTLTNAVNEGATHQKSFIPTKDPIKEIDVLLTAKGTGNWTLTVHDANNILIGSATVANGSLVSATNYQAFTFSTPLRVVNSNTYHFHLSSTTGDGTVQTNTSSDVSTVNYKEFFGILVADTNYHPITTFTNGVEGTIVIGNGNYLAQYGFNSGYSPNKIVFEPGFSVRALTKYDRYVVAICWRGANIDSTEIGRMYFWDGISRYFNYARDVTSGLPNAAVNSKNRLFMVLGSSGDMTLGFDPVRQLQPAPQLARGKKVEVLPGAITVWQRRVHIGMWSADDSSSFEAGVYEFGNQSDRAISYTSVSTEVLNYSYKISTGTSKSTTLKIGCVQAFGKDLYISWKDGSSYGVDKVSKTNNPSATGSWESLILDEGVTPQGQPQAMPTKQKLAVKLVITFPALPTGCTVTPKYRLDRATNFTLGTAEQIGVATNTRCELPINQRYKEVEVGFDCTATTGFPQPTSVLFIYDPLIGERSES